MMRRIERENTGCLSPGQDLVVAGYAGLAGMVILVRKRLRELSDWFSDEYLKEMDECLRLMVQDYAGSFWRELGAVEWESAGEGGILKAIWDLSGAYEMGVEFFLRKIPIRQETIEVCERLELNPYRLYSAGCVLLAADNGGKLVDKLEKYNIPGQVIGRVNTGIAREVIVQDGRGFLERPQPDEIWKLIPDFSR